MNRPSLNPMLPLLTTAALLVMLCLSGCGDNDPSGPGDDPDPVPPIDYLLSSHLLLSSEQLDILDRPPEWTDDDRWIIFTAGPGSIIWKVEAGTGASLIAVTDPDLDHWILGGYSPCGLEGGGIGYFQGLLPGSFGMHIMGAAASTVSGDPPPDILRTFSGIAVGLSENQISSPHELSIDAWGRRGVGTWQTTWIMHWQDREAESVLLTRPATGLEEATGFRISRDGEFVVYRNEEGVVTWIPFNAEEAHPLGPGTHPSFSGDGSQVGYTAPNGHDYVVHPRSGDDPVTYIGDAGIAPLRPTLSWAGDRIAFLVKNSTGTSLYVGHLEH